MELRDTVPGSAQPTESFDPPVQTPNVYADSSGFMPIEPYPHNDQLYTFTAVAIGGTPDTVEVIVHADGGTTGTGSPPVMGNVSVPALRIAGANPFSRRVGLEFEYDVPSPDTIVRIGIFDVAGRRVATLVDGRGESVAPDGIRRGAWRGGNLALVAPGVYLLHMEAGDFRASRKVILFD